MKDYIDTDLSAQELADKMVMIGNGVEDVYDLGKDIDKVVVGKIVKRKAP